MRPTRHVFTLALAGSLAAGLSFQVQAQQTIKIGELNSYKVFAAFLEPYKKGMDLAIEEVNAGGGGCNPIPLRHAVEGEELVIAEADILGGWRLFR